MSATQPPDAFAALQGGPPDTSHLEQGFHDRAQALGDMIVGAFDKGMTAATAKAGDIAGNISAGTSATLAGAGQKFDALAGGAKSAPTTPARSQEVAIEAPSQPMPEHVQSAARAAMSGVSMPNIQMANVDPLQQVSASHTPGVGGQAIGGMAMA